MNRTKNLRRPVNKTDWPRSDGRAKRPTPYDADHHPKLLRNAIADALIAAPSQTFDYVLANPPCNDSDWFRNLTVHA
mgnify:CR=1 FL=1